MLTKKEIDNIYHMCYQLSPKYAADLSQEIYLILLEMNLSKINELRKKNELLYYTHGIIKNQFASRNSKFYRKIKRFDEKRENIQEDGYIQD